MIRSLSALTFLLVGALSLSGETPASILVKSGASESVTLNANDLSAMPRTHFSVPDPQGASVVYEGVSLNEVLRHVGLDLTKPIKGAPLGSYIVASASDGYKVVFSVGELAPDFGNTPVLIADHRNGQPLPAAQGWFRLVCPNDRKGARSVRMLNRIEVLQLTPATP